MAYAALHPARLNPCAASGRLKTVNASNDRAKRYFQGVTGGTLSVAGGMSTVLKSAG